MSHECHPDCQRSMASKEEHDSAERAATVAANLISATRHALKLDPEMTEYSAQFLVDNALLEEKPGQSPHSFTLTVEDCLEYLVNMASPKTEAELEEMEKQQKRRAKITVKDCLECAFKEGIPKRESWAHLGCVSPVPAFASFMPRVPMKGKVIEVKKLEDAIKLMKRHPIAAKLLVFSPEIDHVGNVQYLGVYVGPSGAVGESRYVGLRDVILCGEEKFEGDDVMNVQICYKKRTSIFKVSLTRMVTTLADEGDESQTIEPSGLLVDFVVPRIFK
ncbi:protein HEAT-INDUCED TAS1 TARGET 4 isoform X1 [Brassica rapa]|uniref:protein HEAT-INDUCED TAS1 TARGET 4 isoform X1 n=1 Tax=Brassica campestris TaxID=3711 RepID=UPI00142E0718|nr:protein HEAT-INDUCED TAS1 TARGET 4 isoform X1 [Brassica rapa]